MLNIAGDSYDYGQVLFAVLQECEHVRRSLSDAEAPEKLRATVREKLGEIRACYNEAGGNEAYWKELEQEVMGTAIPRYIPAAIAQNALERSNYQVFRGGDLAARFLFALIGLVIGGIIIAAPFIPIVEDMFAFALAGAGFLYPDLKRMMFERRHFKLLNRIVEDGQAYQNNARIHYMSTSEFTRALDAARSYDPAGTKETDQAAEVPSASPRETRDVS